MKFRRPLNLTTETLSHSGFSCARASRRQRRAREKSGRASSTAPSNGQVTGAVTSGFSAQEVEQRKSELLSALVGVSRGAEAGLEQRSVIEEAKTNLESVGGSIDLERHLEGKWKLVYTTSLDLLPLFWFGYTQLTKIGDIYQEFSKPEEGKVKNIISAAFPQFLDSGTLTVRASFDVRSDRRIQLGFEEAEVNGLQLSDLGKTVLSPALISPARGFPNMRLMQLIQDFSFTAPLTTPLSGAVRDTVGNPTFLLTYLDETLLIGRAIPGEGVYILEKETQSTSESSEE